MNTPETNYKRGAERNYRPGFDPPVINYTEEKSLDGLRLNLPVGWEFSIDSRREHGSYRFILQEFTSSSAKVLLSYMLGGESISSKVRDIMYGHVFRIATEDVKFIVERNPDGVSFSIEFPDASRPSDPKPVAPSKHFK